MSRKNLISTVLVSLFTALIIAGTFIRIPLPPVPITLQTLFVLLAGMLLPIPLSLSSVALYLLLGALGLPVFSSGGGLALLTGPTAGFMFGWLPAVLVCGLMGKVKIENKKFYLSYLILTGLLANVALYIPGLMWLGYSRHMNLLKTLAVGLVPFIPGDIIKLIAASIVTLKLKEKVLILLEKED
ncbi:MAG: biotin transporter BioY [Sphaerochaetaceae bacterium]|nr:biotin transporter BioY [Sphaerochaetaceae bacterium]